VVGRRSGAAGAAYAAALGAVLIAACPPSGAAADVRPPRAQYDIPVEARFRFRFATDGQLPLLAGYAAAVISSVDWYRRPSSRCCAGRGARRNRKNPRGTRVFADSRRGRAREPRQENAPTGVFAIDAKAIEVKFVRNSAVSAGFPQRRGCIAKKGV
jgi:hypothetical protein